MAGIKIVQGSTTINSGGTASFSVPQTGLITGVSCAPSLVGASYSGYAWSVSGPEGSAPGLSGASTAAPTFTPDLQGNWTVTLQGLNSDGSVAATYTIPLYIAQVQTTSYPGPLFLAYCTPAQVATPGLGYTAFQDSTNTGAPSVKNTSATVIGFQLVLSGGVRPTTGLFTGLMFFDTTLGAHGKPVWYYGAGWVLADGTTA